MPGASADTAHTLSSLTPQLKPSTVYDVTLAYGHEAYGSGCDPTCTWGALGVRDAKWCTEVWSRDHSCKAVG
eukprot:3626460-Prymnesium_polylepis.1